jgi:voltage-gated potassium channel
MTAITITTVGYGDVIGLDDKPFGKLFTIVFVLAGAGTIAYLFTALAAYIIEGELREVFRRRKMEKRITKLKDHYIVCGIGMVGLYVVHELFLSKKPLVAIDTDENKPELLKANALEKVDLIVGDATENEVLWNAMIEHAKGLFATTDSDNDNIVISLTARQLNPSLRIISRCNDAKNIDKIRRAGADEVVALNFIGGLRMASEMLRPHVTKYHDKILRDNIHDEREEIHVPSHSPYIGKAVREIDFKGIGNLLIIAARKASNEWVYNPYPDTIIEEGMSMIVIATPDEKNHLVAVISGEKTKEIL